VIFTTSRRHATCFRVDDRVVAFAFILLLLACFATATLQVLWDRRRGATPSRRAATDAARPLDEQLPPPPRPRRKMQVGTVTCEVVSFEDFEVIKTSERLARW
jgi:hypothetical protein